jgi:excinuclease UvrABC helicase subunit UvrB
MYDHYDRLQRAIDGTNRRRRTQTRHSREHGIARTVRKSHAEIAGPNLAFDCSTSQAYAGPVRRCRSGAGCRAVVTMMNRTGWKSD